jgi:hypothetical protein
MSNLSGAHAIMITGTRCDRNSADDRLMRKFRFNIASLLTTVFMIGVGLAALRESSDLWESGIFTVTVGMLMISILLAIHRTESRRAFWIGFALFGWIYLGLSIVPSIESRLLTTKALAFLDSKMPGRSPAITLYTTINSGIGSTQVQGAVVGVQANRPATTSRGQGWIQDLTSSGRLWVITGTPENFVSIGHSLCALMAGWFGGLFSRRLHTKSRDPEGLTRRNQV